MMSVPTDDEFDQLVSDALDSLPKKYTGRMDNVAIVYADEPTQQQRQELNLRGNQTLLGLYQGVPLTARGGMIKLLPDKITLFKIPLVYKSKNHTELQENVRHTLWHEMAHYFGLDHKRIRELE
ncbi:MAG: metallopeptidase family protein [Candidatus Saccharibacteria bacterium]